MMVETFESAMYNLKSQQDYNDYLARLEIEKFEFLSTNPDFPKSLLSIMFLPVCAPRQSIRIFQEI